MLKNGVKAMCSSGCARSLVGRPIRRRRPPPATRADQHVEGRAGGHRGLAHRAHLAVAAEDVRAREVRAAACHSRMKGQHAHGVLRAGPMSSQLRQRQRRPCRRSSRASRKAESRLDDRAGIETLRRGLDRRTSQALRSSPSQRPSAGRCAGPGIARPAIPGDVPCQGRLYRVAPVGAPTPSSARRRQLPHRPGDGWHRAVSIGMRPSAGLEREHAAPRARQPHRAADVGAHVMDREPAAARRAGTGAGAAGFGHVPGVAPGTPSSASAARPSASYACDASACASWPHISETHGGGVQMQLQQLDVRGARRTQPPPGRARRVR